MKLSLKHLLIPLIAIFSSASAHAVSAGGLFVEPMVTYEVGSKTKLDKPVFPDSTGTTDGFGVGARFGFHVADIIFLGLDGRYSMPKYKMDSYEADAQAMNYGLVAGVQTPVLGIRLWGTYILDGNLDPKENTTNTFFKDVKYNQANGYRIGAGLRVAVVSVNLEYQNLGYTSTTLQSPGSVTSDDFKYKSEAWVASVSFPISL